MSVFTLGGITYMSSTMHWLGSSRDWKTGFTDNKFCHILNLSPFLGLSLIIFLVPIFFVYSLQRTFKWSLFSEKLCLGEMSVQLKRQTASVLCWLASPIWVTPRQGRWGGGGPPRWQRRHGPHERRVVGAFSGARAGCGALYSGPLVCRAGPAVILMSIHGSVVPTEVIER